MVLHQLYFSFNPLIQVYVFNNKMSKEVSKKLWGFNPLIQVYVFNEDDIYKYLSDYSLCFNPLIQVYVFNSTITTYDNLLNDIEVLIP